MRRRDLARRLAVVPQETQLAFDYTALEIVLMGRYPHLGAFEIEGPDDLAKARRALETTGTDHLADRPFRTLSGGEKQRVVIASAVAQLDVDGAVRSEPSNGEPEALLLLDEPTASLDLRYQLEVAALVRHLHETRRMTILLSTHDVRYAASLCSTVVLLAKGKVLAHGSPGDVLTADTIARLYDIDAEVAAPLLA
jgi:iron complex transport system ATP-binding protein